MADHMAGASAAAGRCGAASRRVELTGWGRIAPSAAQLAEPADPGQVAELLAGAPGRGVAARGLGRSYNNEA
jgi:decaprenylphospho-beta-D-ribofuranose 2-oxidase